MVHPIPSPKDIQQFYRSLDYWQSHGVSSNFAQRNWRENLTDDGGSWEEYYRARVQMELVLKHTNLSENAKIIELGSGLAPFLYHCKRRGFKNLYALEPQGEICSYLEGQGISTYPMLLETFIAQNDLPRFDVIVLSHTVEHLISPDAILCGLRELLSDQGVLLIVVPYQDHLRPYTFELHLHFFNENSMAHLLTKCGYQTMSIHADQLNAVEAVLIKMSNLLFGAKERIAGKGKKIIRHPLIQHLHRFFWRPLKRMLRLKINIYRSYEDLYALAKR